MRRVSASAIGLVALALGWAIFAAVYAWAPLSREIQSGPQSGLAAGLAAFDARHYSDARQDFATLAKAGNPQAEMWLAYMDARGFGAAPDPNAAIGEYTKAADGGSAEAARRLGELYLRGRGVLQNVAAARSWIERAALEGDPEAERDLGEIYVRGIGVPKDAAQGYAWLDIAASRGDRAAVRERDDVLATLSPDAVSHAEDVAQTTLGSISKTTAKLASAKGSAPASPSQAASGQPPEHASAA